MYKHVCIYTYIHIYIYIYIERDIYIYIHIHIYIYICASSTRGSRGSPIMDFIARSACGRAEQRNGSLRCGGAPFVGGGVQVMMNSHNNHE